MFKERIFVTALVIFLKKDSCLLKQFNLHIHNLASTGLLKFWGEKYLEDYSRKIPQQKVPEKLTLSHLEGILYVCVVFYSISFLVFLLEVILWKIQQRLRS